MEQFYTPAQAAAIIGVGAQAVQRRIREGHIRALVVGGGQQIRYLLTAETVEAERLRIADKPHKNIPDSGSSLRMPSPKPAKSTPPASASKAPKTVHKDAHSATIARAIAQQSVSDAQREANLARIAEIAAKATTARYYAANGAYIGIVERAR